MFLSFFTLPSLISCSSEPCRHPSALTGAWVAMPRLRIPRRPSRSLRKKRETQWMQMLKAQRRLNAPAERSPSSCDDATCVAQPGRRQICYRSGGLVVLCSLCSSNGSCLPCGLDQIMMFALTPHLWFAGNKRVGCSRIPHDPVRKRKGPGFVKRHSRQGHSNM